MTISAAELRHTRIVYSYMATVLCTCWRANSTESHAGRSCEVIEVSEKE